MRDWWLRIHSWQPGTTARSHPKAVSAVFSRAGFNPEGQGSPHLLEATRSLSCLQQPLTFPARPSWEPQPDRIPSTGASQPFGPMDT